MLTNILVYIAKKRNNSTECSIVIYLDKSNNSTRIIEHTKAVNTKLTNEN